MSTCYEVEPPRLEDIAEKLAEHVRTLVGQLATGEASEQLAAWADSSELIAEALHEEVLAYASEESAPLDLDAGSLRERARYYAGRALIYLAAAQSRPA